MKCLATARRAGPIAAVLLLAAGCTTLPESHLPPVVDQGVQSPEPAAPPEGVAPGQPASPAPPGAEPPAVVALLEHAEQQANAGDLEAAAVTLERAIRIDSRNPLLWHHLATLRLAEGDPAQAEQLAVKSNSLAAGNHALQALNWELIAQARRSRGDAAGARAAEQRARDARRPPG